MALFDDLIDSPTAVLTPPPPKPAAGGMFSDLAKPAPVKPIGAAEQFGRIEWPKRMPFSPAGLVDAARLYTASKRLSENDYPRAPVTLPTGQTIHPATPQAEIQRKEDELRIEDYFSRREEEAQRGMTFPAKVLTGASYLPAWMVEFGLTGGLATIGKKGATKAAQKALGKIAATKAGQAAVKTTGWLGGAAVRTTVGMPHRVGEAVLARRLEEEPENWATSAAKGWGEVFIEVASETAGAAISRGLKTGLSKLPFGKIFINKLQSAWMKISPDNTAKVFANNIFTRAGYHGIIGEIGEERLATLMHAIANTYDFGAGKDAGFFERLSAGINQDIKNFPVEATVLSLPAAGRFVLGKVIGEAKPPVKPLGQIPAMDAELAAVQRTAMAEAKRPPMEKAPIAPTEIRPIKTVEEIEKPIKPIVFKGVTETPPIVEEKAPEIAPEAKPVAEKPLDIVKPKLYIGNVTQRMKKVFGEEFDVPTEEIHGFTEGAFPTKRTEVTLTKKEAVGYSKWLEDGIQYRLDNNLIKNDAQLSKLNADWGDLKEMRSVLGQKAGVRPFKVVRATIHEKVDLSEIKGPMKFVAGDKKHYVVILPTVKARVEAATHPPSMFVSGMTVQQVLSATMKKAEIASAKAYVEGARDIVRIHKDLSRYAHEKLKGLDISQADRNRLLSFVSATRNATQKTYAIAAIEMMGEKADRAKAIAELNIAAKKIRPRIGKTMQEKGIRPEYAKKLNTLIDSFTTKKLSQWRIKDIGSLKNYLSNLKEGISNDPSIDEQYRAKLAEMLIPERRISQLDKLSKSSIHLLKAEDIRTITTELQRLVHLNDVKNTIYLNQKARSAADYLSRAVEEQQAVKDESKLPKVRTLETTRQKGGALRVAGRFIAGADNHDMKTLAFTIEGGKEGAVCDAIVESFRDGRRVESTHKVEILKYIHKFLADNNITQADLAKMSSGFSRAFRGKRGQRVKRLAGRGTPLYEVKIAGKQINLTIAELMSVYMHAQSDFNLKAMLKEGVASIKEPIGTLSPEELARIVQIVQNNPKALTLTKMYAHIAEKINKPAINETSMDLKGIEIADVDNYFTVERYTRGKVAGNQEYQINLLESQGFLQERTGSKNPIVIRDFFAVLMSNIDGVSEYVGMAKPFRAAHTLLGYKKWAEIVDNKGHELQRRHLNQLMEHTEQKPRVSGRMEAVFGKVLRGAPRAVLAEPGIMAGQIMSEINYAATDIPKKYLLTTSPVPSAKEVERACEEFSWMWIRRNLGAASIVTRDISRTDAALRALTGKKAIINLPVQGINYVDMKAITFGRKAVEKWVSDTTNLKGQEYISEVNKRTHKAVSESQPMFETENRSILTSNPNVLAKAFFLFRSYIDQTLRIMSRASTAQRNEIASKSKMASQFGIIFAGFAAYKMLRILVNALLYRRKKDPYEIAKDILLSPMRALNVVGYPAERQISRMLDIGVGRRPKTRYFDIGFENLVTSTINEVWDATKDYGDAVAYLGTGEVYKSGPNKGKLKSEILLWRATEKMAYGIGKIVGLPTPSLRRFRYGWKKKEEPQPAGRIKPMQRIKRIQRQTG